MEMLTVCTLGACIKLRASGTRDTDLMVKVGACLDLTYNCFKTNIADISQISEDINGRTVYPCRQINEIFPGIRLKKVNFLVHDSGFL